MRKTLKPVIAVILCLLPAMVLATTWNEPWHEQVVKEADSFVRVQVLKNENGQRAVVKTLKQVAGAVVPAEFTIDQFWLLQIASSTAGYGPELHLKSGTVYYVLVKKNRSGPNWALPTPTAGFAETEDEQVKATYRHSYHMGLVPTSLYEPTMTAIFRFLHNQPYDTPYIAQLFKQQLTLPPGDLTRSTESETTKRFFAQHAALECFYYFGTASDYALLEPFLRSAEPHVQISAVRALSAVKTDSARKRLMEFIEGDRDPFAKIMAVWALKRLNARDYLPRLNAYAAKAREETAGFGGSIMDPRVGTIFPGSVKAAIEELIKEWQSSPTSKTNSKN